MQLLEQSHKLQRQRKTCPLILSLRCLFFVKSKTAQREIIASLFDTLLKNVMQSI